MLIKKIVFYCFDDTVASLEEGLFNRRDVLTLIDDFYGPRK